MAVTSLTWRQQLPRENFPSGEKLKWILSVQRPSSSSVRGQDPFCFLHTGNAGLTLFSWQPFSPSVSDVLFIHLLKGKVKPTEVVTLLQRCKGIMKKYSVWRITVLNIFRC